MTTARDLALAQLGHGPADVSQVAGLLMSHGHNYPDAQQKARESLAALVLSGHAEEVMAQGHRIYRLSATTPVEKSTEPAPKAKGVRR